MTAFTRETLAIQYCEQHSITPEDEDKIIAAFCCGYAIANKELNRILTELKQEE